MHVLYSSLILLFTLTNTISAAEGPILLSQKLLEKAKTNHDFHQELNSLETLSIQELSQALEKENNRLVFWINLYNAFIIIKLKSEKELFLQSRNKFFSKRWIQIAGKKLSFDDIEHGLLRRSKQKFSLGYLNKFFFSIDPFERQFRVNRLDYRIHFALNCGATSCPPLLYYTPEQLDDQLNMAMSAFLDADSQYKEETQTLYVSKIFFWFQRDFGGKKGILRIHRHIIPINSQVKIKYKAYNWTPIY